MNKLFPILLLVFTTLFSSAQIHAELPDLDELDVSSSVDIRSFIVGEDGDVGTLIYIVDRTSGNCFATIKQKSSASGITAIKCDFLITIPKIAEYMQTGKVQ